jgi:hypothetical protein
MADPVPTGILREGKLLDSPSVDVIGLEQDTEASLRDSRMCLLERDEVTGDRLSCYEKAARCQELPDGKVRKLDNLFLPDLHHSYQTRTRGYNVSSRVI